MVYSLLNPVYRRLPSLCDTAVSSHRLPATLRSVSSVSSSPAEPDVSCAAKFDPTRLQSPDRLYRLLELEMRAHDSAVLDSYVWFLRQSAGHLDIEVTGEHRPKVHYHRFHVAKAAFGKGKHRVQYEVRTYSRILELSRLTGSTADTYLEYAQRMLPEGVAMKVTRHAREAVPQFLCQSLEEATGKLGSDDNTHQSDSSAVS